MEARATTTRRRIALVLAAACVLAIVVAVAMLTRPREPELACCVPPPVAAHGDDAAGVDASSTELSADARTAIALSIEARVEEIAPGAAVTTSRLHGTVRPAPGHTQLAGEGIIATDAHGRDHRSFCSESGDYAFEDLEPGTYWVSMRSPRTGRANATVEVRGEARLDLQLEAPRVIAIHVVDEIGQATAANDLIAVATSEPPGDWCDDVRGATTNPVGCGWFASSRIPFPEPPPEMIGRLHVDRAPPFFVSLCKYQRVLETRRVEADVARLEFVLRTDDERSRNGGIRLRVVDAESRAPLEKVAITVTGRHTRFGRSVAGVCTLEDLEPGTHRLQLMKADYGAQRIDVRVTSGDVNDLGDVALSKATWVAGRILDEMGVGGLYTIRFDPCESDGRVAPVHDAIWTFSTNADGSFRATGLAPGFHRLEVMHAANGDRPAVCVAVFDVRDGPVENARLTVTTGVPFVVDPSGKHGPESRFAVLDESGMRVLSRLVTQPEPMSFRLQPGRYTAEFTSSRDDPAARSVAFEIVRETVLVAMR